VFGLHHLDLQSVVGRLDSSAQTPANNEKQGQDDSDKDHVRSYDSADLDCEKRLIELLRTIEEVVAVTSDDILR
jgi:hypothetical protein